MHPNDITLSVVTSAAKQFVANYHSSLQIPIPIEEIAELQLDIFFNLIPGIKELLGIDAFISADFSQITIDEFCYSKYHARTRFSIAHEIGHKILHADWYNNHGPKTVDDALTFQEKLDEIIYMRIENQANTFAGLVLVPTEILLSEVRGIVGTSRGFPLIPPPPMQDLVEKFDVSSEVLFRRMLKEHIIQDPSIPF